MRSIKDFSGGRLEYRNDDGGNIHLPVGRTDFADADMKWPPSTRGLIFAAPYVLQRD